MDREMDGAALAARPVTDVRRSADTGHWITCLLDHIDYGLVVLDEGGAALHANRAAREWLASARTPLRLQSERVEAVAAQDGGQFRRALAAAVSRGSRTLLSFDGAGEGFAVAIGPLCGGGVTLPGRALLVIGRRQVCDALTAQMFASRHGLTLAESQVLQLLCTGLAPREIAQRQQVAVSTVRTQIGSLRAKTRARTIGTLVREVALLPPLGHALAACRAAAFD
jgi:DNA-binding CsgD family transcriptional regulator